MSGDSEDDKIHQWSLLGDSCGTGWDGKRAPRRGSAAPNRARQAAWCRVVVARAELLQVCLPWKRWVLSAVMLVDIPSSQNSLLGELAFPDGAWSLSSLIPFLTERKQKPLSVSFLFSSWYLPFSAPVRQWFAHFCSLRFILQIFPSKRCSLRHYYLFYIELRNRMCALWAAFGLSTALSKSCCCCWMWVHLGHVCLWWNVTKADQGFLFRWIYWIIKAHATYFTVSWHAGVLLHSWAHLTSFWKAYSICRDEICQLRHEIELLRTKMCQLVNGSTSGNGNTSNSFIRGSLFVTLISEGMKQHCSLCSLFLWRQNCLYIKTAASSCFNFKYLINFHFLLNDTFLRNYIATETYSPSFH